MDPYQKSKTKLVSADDGPLCPQMW